MFQDRSGVESPSGPESPKASSKVNVRRRNSGAGRSAPLVNRIKDAAADVYQKAVVELILRRKHVTVSTDGRRIPLELEHETPLIDARRGLAYVSNSIRTSRYTVWDFIPKQLFFQFSRVGNFYFLCVGIPQMIPGLSTTGSYTTILPLLFFVMLTIVKEGYDDYRRYRLDKIENAGFATVLGREDKYTGKLRPVNKWTKLNPFLTQSTAEPHPVPEEEFNGLRWVPVRWSEIKVGDIIRLCRDEPIPADLVLLHSDGENKLAYIETMALDGETNLKSKQVTPALEGCDTIEGISKCKADFVVENPNPDLYNFDGRVTVSEKTVPLTSNEVIYRGSVVRNTNTAIGLVINTGEDCKIRMNANKHPKAKKPALERVVNKIVVTLATYVVVLSVGVSMGYVKWQKSTERHSWYLEQAKVPFYQIIIAFIIMFNNVVPLSLYISLEIVKIGQLLMLNSDVEMYDEETDTPARCNTNTILENLGQVGYVFSDKTGTLTDNIMKFRKISVAGTVWLHEMDLEPKVDEVEDFKLDEESEPSEPSVYKTDPVTVVIREEQAESSNEPSAPLVVASPSRPSMSPRPSMSHRPSMAPSRPSMAPSRNSFGSRRSSSQWRSTGRPDHIQPDVTTNDLIEYLRLRPNSGFARKAKQYILAVALCHTCLPEYKENGALEFQAASPDELALVRAAQELGYLVINRTTQTITLRVTQPDGHEEELKYEVLDVIEFTSARKKMSIVVRFPDGRVSVICKGADSAILPRLKMSQIAKQKASEVRKSAELERELYRRSEQQEPRNSFGGRPSLTIRRNPGVSRDRSTSRRPNVDRSKSFEFGRLSRRSEDKPLLSIATRGVSIDLPRGQYLNTPVHYQQPIPEHLAFLEDPALLDDSETFSKCFKHMDDFASEGLRTLLFAQKFITEQEYQAWKKIWDEATTSLSDRQQHIEDAGDMIEQSFDLVGATAIEDKLQKGVPETIERLRKANIKVWMLTGDKRETAINIAHSARICRPGSDLYILDITKGSLDSQLIALQEDLSAGSVHSVVVIDGQTLAAVEKSPELSATFFTVMLQVNSVICCRASPAQKALLVSTVRSRLKKYHGRKRRGLTLAIGDGANDLAMISASHVGIGISGKEGLQAARVADYAIAQFRFLQRMLLVHGRWNYIRTAKFILYTFWKEMFFYLPTAQYQRYTGYSGTSLYEATSLTVFNTLFTSLCVICMGIWEQDLSAETLLAVPELYVYGQRNQGLNIWKFGRWMLLGAIEGVVCWYGIWAGYGWISPAARDQGLYALGTLTFSVGVLWINWKLFIFETHYKSTIVMVSFFVTTIGWFAWLCFLDAAYAGSPSGPYAIRNSFTELFGDDAVWWSTLFIVLGLLGLFEIVLKCVKRLLLIAGLWDWPPWGKSRRGDNIEEWDVELWQELEQDPALRERLKRLARDEQVEEEDEFEHGIEEGLRGR
ncbi:phospholipid-transporting ATPase DNF3 [Fusarium subglutinans]|uniref:Phospholipid-transporting ATPase n=1 Tax=Gibberella subglutinans TaxID=42677 RepID=A0A8H5PFR4_GIBSU|nr:phospholipid-transporting ATPase DNF3 [Fusarium subglutinans]KAF5595869.1 phospholipid-transporting ATPase DNF3 [Fusarium subglutinans]